MKGPASRFALFSYGFRPFFLLTALYAVIAMTIWLATLVSGNWPAQGLLPHLWHGHEMLFGFVAAAIAGFLLTAVPSWTGHYGYSGLPLIALVIIWLAGRVAMACHACVPLLPIAIVDLAFFPALAIMLTPALRRGKLRNLVFLLLLVVLFLANLLFHVAVAREDTALAGRGLLLGVNTVLLIISIIGGRVVPAFTTGAVRRTDPTFVITPLPLLDRAAISSIFLMLLIDLAWPYSTAAGWLAVIAALLHAVRFARWHTWRSKSEAIVWILHAGYAWLIVGLALKGVFLLTAAEFTSAWLHAFTTGAFATMIMAIMSRAALGHTGRPLLPPRLVVLSFLLITLAAIVRVAGPLFPAVYLHSIMLAGGLWIAAFLLFLVVYTPILIAPRADGKAG